MTCYRYIPRKPLQVKQYATFLRYPTARLEETEDICSSVKLYKDKDIFLKKTLVYCPTKKCPTLLTVKAKAWFGCRKEGFFKRNYPKKVGFISFASLRFITAQADIPFVAFPQCPHSILLQDMSKCNLCLWVFSSSLKHRPYSRNCR